MSPQYKATESETTIVNLPLRNQHDLKLPEPVSAYSYKSSPHEWLEARAAVRIALK